MEEHSGQREQIMPGLEGVEECAATSRLQGGRVRVLGWMRKTREQVWRRLRRQEIGSAMEEENLFLEGLASFTSHR